MTHKVSIYQIADVNSNKVFQNYEKVVEKYGGIKLSDYKKVYECTHATTKKNTTTILDEIYARFNGVHPEDYKGRSISISDIIVLDGIMYYVDTMGFEMIDQVM